MALVAACVLLLQGLFGAFATGSAHAGQMLDAFGNPLCIGGMVAMDQPSDEGGHSGFPDCCTGLCGLLAPATLADRAAHSLFNPLAVSVKLVPTPRVAVFHSMPEHSPGIPRAPPPAAA